MAKREQQELSQETINRITHAVRSLAEDRVDRGFDLNKPIQCSSCGEQKPSQGASRYGAYIFCNDCLLDFTLALSKGSVDNVADFMTRRSEQPGPIVEISSLRDRSSLQSNPLPRDKFMPSNEPI